MIKLRQYSLKTMVYLHILILIEYNQTGDLLVCYQTDLDFQVSFAFVYRLVGRYTLKTKYVPVNIDNKKLPLLSLN